MSDPQIKYDIKADVTGDAEADKLATALRGVGDVLEGDLQQSAQDAAKALEALTAKQRAVDEFARLKAEARETATALDAATKAVDALGNQLPQASANTRTLAEAEKAMATELEKSQAELAAKKQALAQLRTETDSASKKTDDYKAAVAGLKAEIAATSGEIKTKKAELTSTTQGLTQAQAAEAALTKEYKQATAEAAKASAELGGYNRKLDESRAALKAAGIDTGNLSQAKQNLSKAVSVAQADLKKLGETSVASGAVMKRSGKDAATGIEEISTQLQRVQNAYIALQGGGELGSMIKSALETADAYNNLESRIKLATGGGKDFAGTMKDVADISLRTHSSLTTTGDLFSKLAASGKSAGLSAKDAQMQALALTESINQAVQLSGASAQASDAAITQLVQGLNGGALRGDEFNSVMEQSPRLAKAMADGLGVTTGELRKMAEAGSLTAETVIRSLRSQSDTLKTEFSSLPPTVGRAIQDLGTAWMLYVGEADKGTGASVAAATAIDALSKNLKTVAGFLIDAGQAAVGFTALKLAQHFLGIGAAATASATAITATATATTAAGTAAAATTVQMGRMAAALATLRAFTLIGIITNFKDIGTWIGESIAKLQGYKDKTAELIKQEEEQRKALQEKKNQQLLANDAIKAAESAQLGLTKATAATVDKFEQLVKSGKSASDAITEIGKEFDLSKLPGIRDAGVVLNALVAKGKITATEFQQAWADALKGEDLAVFAAKAGAAFDSTGRDAEVAAKITEQVLIAAVGRAGASYEALAGKVSKASASAINDTQAIINGLGQLEKMGIDTGAALQASIGNGINTANTQAALDAVKAQIEQVRRVLGDKIADGLLDQASEKAISLKDALDKATPGATSLAEALGKLGIASDASLKKAADDALKLAEAVKASGGSARETAAAFADYATKAIAANNGVVPEVVKVTAAMNGLKIETDSTGKAIVSTMETVAAVTARTSKEVQDAFAQQAASAQEFQAAQNQMALDAAAAKEAEAAAADKAAEATKNAASAAISYEAVINSMRYEVGYAGDAVGVFNQKMMDAWTSAGSFSSFEELGRFLNSAALQAKDAAVEFDSLTDAIARQNAGNTSAAQGVDNLKLRLLEIEGTEQEIAAAKDAREKNNILRMQKVAEMEARRAELAGDTKARDQYRAEAAALKEQLALLEKIDQAERRRDQRAAESAAQSARQTATTQAATPATQAQQSAGAAKTYNVTFGGRTVKTASDADAQALMQMLNDARLSA